MRGVIAVAWLNAEAQLRSPWRLLLKVLGVWAFAWLVSWDRGILAAAPREQVEGLLAIIAMCFITCFSVESADGPASTLPIDPLAAGVGSAIGKALPALGPLWLASLVIAVTGILWLPWLVEATAAGLVHPAVLALTVDPALLGLDATGRAIALGPPTPWRAAATVTALALLLQSAFLMPRYYASIVGWLVTLGAWSLAVVAWLLILPGETVLARAVPLVAVGVPFGFWASTRPQVVPPSPRLNEPPQALDSSANAGDALPTGTPTGWGEALVDWWWDRSWPRLSQLKHRTGLLALLRSVLWKPRLFMDTARGVAWTYAACLCIDIMYSIRLGFYFPALILSSLPVFLVLAVCLFIGAMIFAPLNLLDGPELPFGGGSTASSEAIDLLPVTRSQVVAEIVLGELLVVVIWWMVLGQIWTTPAGHRYNEHLVVCSLPLWVAAWFLLVIARPTVFRHVVASSLVAVAFLWFIAVYNGNTPALLLSLIGLALSLVAAIRLALRRPRCG